MPPITVCAAASFRWQLGGFVTYYMLSLCIGGAGYPHWCTYCFLLVAEVAKFGQRRTRAMLNGSSPPVRAVVTSLQGRAGGRLESARSEAGTCFTGIGSPSTLGSSFWVSALLDTSPMAHMHVQMSSSTSSLFPPSLRIVPYKSRFSLPPSFLLSSKSQITPALFLPSRLGQFIVLISDELAAQIPFEAPDPL